MPENDNVIHAPFTPEQVERLRRRQEDVSRHPYTCGEPACGTMVMVPAEEGWTCECGYTMDWAWRADVE